MKEYKKKNHLLEIPISHAKMCLKSAPQKLKFVMTKVTSKRYALDGSYKCLCTLPHSYA